MAWNQRIRIYFYKTGNIPVYEHELGVIVIAPWKCQKVRGSLAPGTDWTNVYLKTLCSYLSMRYQIWPCPLLIISTQICFRSGINEPVGRIWSENFRFLFALVRSDPTNDRLRCVDFYSSQFRKNGQDNLSPFDPLKSHLFFAFMANQCIFPSVLKSKGTKDYRTSDDLRRDDLEGHEI